ncbi:hypothetical protein FOL47_007317, partial [Perkinsus chesapeaki]
DRLQRSLSDIIRMDNVEEPPEKSSAFESSRLCLWIYMRMAARKQLSSDYPGWPHSVVPALFATDKAQYCRALEQSSEFGLCEEPQRLPQKSSTTTREESSCGTAPV